ncbi:helix-turn-helix transcriptional regulator [Microvirga sp. 3-52]|uniref:helix-turn-helix domain-containing protein n=1 Tax=Microvirga sp. 3-52 TaxID=2792425 RepID=UPI001AC56CFD|nr:helix-turn-helix transcriptional regulator [Microvirga sp. 3-52]MBO1905595.1 helix-turn-helix transcriptional regulator [Microvirga sp. 3-52]MBS7452679.1 helix-turn-helix transcriptional regulator [Microvirga sp. 3-52]
MQKKSPNQIDKHIGGRVKARRILLGMSQEKLADALGLTFQQVQKYEKGVNRIGASRLLHMAAILDVNIEFFFEGVPGLRAGGFSDDSLVAEFLTRSESDRLVRGFLKLKDDETRRKVADLVDWLASAS